MQAAINAVDAAAKELPADGDVKYSVQEAQEGGGWNQRGGDPAPINPGSRVSVCLRMNGTLSEPSLFLTAGGWIDHLQPSSILHMRLTKVFRVGVTPDSH